MTERVCMTTGGERFSGPILAVGNPGSRHAGRIKSIFGRLVEVYGNRVRQIESMPDPQKHRDRLLSEAAGMRGEPFRIAVASGDKVAGATLAATATLEFRDVTAGMRVGVSIFPTGGGCDLHGAFVGMRKHRPEDLVGSNSAALLHPVEARIDTRTITGAAYISLGSSALGADAYNTPGANRPEWLSKVRTLGYALIHAQQTTITREGEEIDVLDIGFPTIPRMAGGSIRLPWANPTSRTLDAYLIKAKPGRLVGLAQLATGTVLREQQEEGLPYTFVPLKDMPVECDGDARINGERLTAPAGSVVSVSRMPLAAYPLVLE